MLILYHIVSFSVGFLLDFLIGDPHWMPHPIKLIGRFVGWLDKVLMGEGDLEKKDCARNSRREIKKGALCVFIVVFLTFLLTAASVVLGYWINPLCGIAIEAILTAYCLAAKSLKSESMRVYAALKKGDIEAARGAVSMIVGRDTACLDEKGITKAAVETVAENTSDGVIAPMLYLIIGGPVLAMTYKAVNTMDSMIAYHNDRYEYFGKVAAKLDDVVNFIPSRLSAGLMIFVSYISRGFDGKNAAKIWKRDRLNHKSPNSAQTESVCAGALKVQLAGDAFYFGRLVQKPFIGDMLREIEVEDIKKANHLMYRTVLLMYLLGVVSLGVLFISQVLIFN